MEENKESANNQNLTNDNIANRIAQLRNGKNNSNMNFPNNSFNSNSASFQNTFPTDNSVYDETDENIEELNYYDELAQENESLNNNVSNPLDFFSNQSNKKEKEDINVTDFIKKFDKAKKIASVIISSIPFVLPIVVVIIVVAVTMGQIMTVRDNIDSLARKFTTGIEKIVNFAQGDGWMTNEQYFFNYLNKQYEAFEDLKSTGAKLDIPLIAATIHYSKQVDFEQYEEKEPNDDLSYSSSDFEQLGEMITKDQTASFYRVAEDKVGSVSSIFPGQKRLLGHLSNVKLEPGFYDYNSAAAYWEDFFNYALNIVTYTGIDLKDETILQYAVHPISSFIKLYQEMEYYLNNYDDITYGTKYDKANNLYELEEFIHMFSEAFETAQNTSDGSSNDSGMFFSIKITTSMNYGYEEYLDLKKLMLQMKAILSENNVIFTSEDDVLKQAETTSNSELKSLYDRYKEIEDDYKYSYTHYLEKLYIPFTYFYNQECSDSDIDIIIEEIYDQRDFYNYIVDEETNNTNSCSGSCIYPVDGEEINNLKVRLLQCSDLDLGQPIPGEELVDFEKYILGVVYAEIGAYAPTEAAKTQAISARNFALTRPKRMGNASGLKLEKEGDNWVLSIRNCVEDQVYCDPEQGCSSIATPTGSNAVTMFSGVNTKSDPYTGPLPEDAPIRSAVSEVAGKVLIDEDGNLVKTSYTSVNQNKWKEQANEGMDYTEILLAEYEEGRTISTSLCNNVCNKATGDFTQWKQCGAPWSNVIIGNGKSICDIGCLATSVSIQIARSGLPLQDVDGEFNPGTFVEAIKPNGFIYYDENGNSIPGGTLFVYDSATALAPNFKYQGALHTSLTGKTKAQKAMIVQNLIDQGCYVIMEVKGNGGGEHWVAVDYVENGNVYMMDPASTEVNTWNLYPHHWTTQAVCYKVTS